MLNTLLTRILKHRGVDLAGMRPVKWDLIDAGLLPRRRA
jgi:hypothetical protein